MRKGIFTAIIGLLILVLVSASIISMKTSQEATVNPKPESFTNVTTAWLNSRILLDNNATADAIFDAGYSDFSTNCVWGDTSNLEAKLETYYGTAFALMKNGCEYYTPIGTDFLNITGTNPKTIAINFRIKCDQNMTENEKIQFQTLFDQTVSFEKNVEFALDTNPTPDQCIITITDLQSNLKDLEVRVNMPS